MKLPVFLYTTKDELVIHNGIKKLCGFEIFEMATLFLAKIRKKFLYNTTKIYVSNIDCNLR